MMLSLFIKGIIIGIIVSSPMGPIGLLCIQRTLNKSRLHGFVSGVGAAISDSIYAVITCMGLDFVFTFIKDYRLQLQFIGSFLLLVYGVYTYRTNPSKSLTLSKNIVNKKYKQDLITSFLLTFSNPFILFLFIALYTRFEFVSTGSGFIMYFIGIFGIILGALSWWFFITYLVDKLRNVFNLRGLWIINKVIGSIIIILSLVGFVLSILRIK